MNESQCLKLYVNLHKHNAVAAANIVRAAHCQTVKLKTLTWSMRSTNPIFDITAERIPWDSPSTTGEYFNLPLGYMNVVYGHMSAVCLNYSSHHTLVKNIVKCSINSHYLLSTHATLKFLNHLRYMHDTNDKCIPGYL